MTLPVELDVAAQRRERFTDHRHPLLRLGASYALSLVVQEIYALFVSREVLFQTDIAIYIVSALVITVSLWRIFENAGLPRWAAIVPFYNFAMIYRLVGRPPRQGWLLLVPILNVYLYIRLMNELSRVFGGDRIFTVVLLISPFIGFPMLAFSRKAVYRAPALSI